MKEFKDIFVRAIIVENAERKVSKKFADRVKCVRRQGRKEGLTHSSSGRAKGRRLPTTAATRLALLFPFSCRRVTDGCRIATVLVSDSLLVKAWLGVVLRRC